MTKETNYDQERMRLLEEAGLNKSFRSKNEMYTELIEFTLNYCISLEKKVEELQKKLEKLERKEK